MVLASTRRLRPPFDSIFCSIYVLLHRFANLTICSPGLTDALVTCPPRFLKVDGWGCVGAGWWACRYIFTLFFLFLFLPGLLDVLCWLVSVALCFSPPAFVWVATVVVWTSRFCLRVCEMSTSESQGSFVMDAPIMPDTTLGYSTLKPFGLHWSLVYQCLGAPTTHTYVHSPPGQATTPRRA